jgi:hypothetical protein
MTRNKFDRAYKVYKRIAKSNKKSADSLDDIKAIADKKMAIKNALYTESESSSVDSNSINKHTADKQDKPVQILYLKISIHSLL